MNCGLLGRKLGHSYSPQIHKFLGDYSYDLFEKEPEELDSFFANPPFDAMNVTIPYKETVIVRKTVNFTEITPITTALSLFLTAFVKI